MDAFGKTGKKRFVDLFTFTVRPATLPVGYDKQGCFSDGCCPTGNLPVNYDKHDAV